MLRRLVRCGHCGVKLAAHRAYRDYGMACYYACPHCDLVRAGGQDRRCPERRIRADELDNFVFDQVRQLLGRPSCSVPARPRWQLRPRSPTTSYSPPSWPGWSGATMPNKLSGAAEQTSTRRA